MRGRKDERSLAAMQLLRTPWVGSSVNRAQARRPYDSATSTSGSSPTVAEKRSSGMRCILNAEEGVQSTRHTRGLVPCSEFFDQPDASSFFEAVSGRNHSETWTGCIVSRTTPTSSASKASRSVSSLSLAEKASRVFAASYFLR